MSSRTSHSSILTDAPERACSASIPLTLVTGFLGSGKSSFINSAIKHSRGSRIGVLVNEFGDIGVESEIIQAHQDDIVELSGGCMCCRLRDDLIGALRTLLDHAGELDHILVEASGLSDPLPIANTFHGNNVEGRVHYDAMICIIDAVHFESAYKDYTVAVRQLNYAHFLVITKAEQRSKEELDALRQLLSTMAPEARVDVLGADISAAELVAAAQTSHAERVAELREAEAEGRSLGAAPAQSREPEAIDPSGSHLELSTTLSSTMELTDRDEVIGALRQVGSALLRAKGRLFVRTAEGGHVIYIVQCVAGSCECYPCPRPAGLEARSTLLLISARNADLTLPFPLSQWRREVLQ